MPNPTQRDREALADKISAAIEAFHDSIGDQGDMTGIGEGKALCQLFYDSSDEIIESLRHRSHDTARIEALEGENARLREAANTLRTEAVLHFNNSVGCATNHYGEDFETHGLPGWIKDSADRIEIATQALGNQP